MTRSTRSRAVLHALRGVALAANLLVASAGRAAAEAQATPSALAPAKVLDVRGKVLPIEGVTLGVQGALRDLGAKVTDREIRIELSADVLFDFDESDLRPDAVASLTKVAAVIASQPGRPVVIEGHTDAKGADDYNQKLSEARAAAVRTWLVKQAGVEPGRVSTKGWGETKPKAPNQKPDGSDDPEGRQQNRRVEIVIRTA